MTVLITGIQASGFVYQVQLLRILFILADFFEWDSVFCRIIATQSLPGKLLKSYPLYDLLLRSKVLPASIRLV